MCVGDRYTENVCGGYTDECVLGIDILRFSRLKKSVLRHIDVFCCCFFALNINGMRTLELPLTSSLNIHVCFKENKKTGLLYNVEFNVVHISCFCSKHRS